MQDIVCKCRSRFIQKRHDPVALTLGSPHDHLGRSPADILKFKQSQLSVAQPGCGEHEHDRLVPRARWLRNIDRVDGAPDILPWEPRWQMRQTPAWCPGDEAGKILADKFGPPQKPEKSTSIRGRC